ncbi:4-hydroxythreonine-4-phosphate dehydrogenase [Candidatus Nitrosoglobus terrae]|uniref:4-hydroxythreonine-4-phosphate dehydrogenase n=1 Tax=Candidatus Nitrosoglobus terrae TaxID=1630141 RepID=A0A1Q2SNR1_9GAMM|nr:4-hydroxythreonine-4-phosphate dehydrogenase PdxA [Candidatus Nitrosoglobus terrae]BAW80737.1 4-hydroxythreonine-4-phosphate dehydrogenase [Candidatus Nitrosoglobus terrae]
MTYLRLALTPGEPAGIGPDIVVQLAGQQRHYELVVIADPEVLIQRSKQRGLSIITEIYDPMEPPKPGIPGRLKVLPLKTTRPVIPGHLSADNVTYVLDCLRQGVAGCISGEFAALITGPLHKGIINQAGIAFTGHTEFLAQLCGVSQVVMMLAAPGLRVALATTHLPLSKVSSAVTRQSLEGTLRILHRDLQRRFGISRPQILVCGLNPHAGEGGYLGDEEIKIIQPVLEILRVEGMALLGPLPADTLFIPPYLKKADAVLAMYHDQGLPVLKHLGFGQAVNITLGLPIIRTSVDHGTALELAGSGSVDTGSLQAAINAALEMASFQQKS